jgi:hypothetical protein
MTHIIKMDKVISYLKIHIWARERANRKVAILNNLSEEHKWIATLQTRQITDFLADYMKLDKYFREVERLYPELRGQDWEDGKVLSQSVQQEFGYEPNYEREVAMLRKII